MARYFFTVVDGSSELVDEVGQECPTLEAAKAVAATIAAELAEDGDHYHACSIVVTDYKGNEVARVPVKAQ